MAQTWEQIKDIVSRAIAMPPAERQKYVETACGDRPKLRAEVESLLRSHDEAPGFIEGSAAQWLLPKTVWTDRTLGPYRIASQIGEGGMGAVYLAERIDDEYRGEVAIKVLKPGGNLRSVASRFRNERQILARLNHPNIARLFDGGTTEEGLPYFVMELIEGQPIDEYCEKRQLPAAARLKLFRQVCAAVHYAHRNLIVHRDLKPGNILITRDGQPKLLDFGIAKILDPEFDAAPATQTKAGPMTPEYASPEQMRGEPITTASDVYSLGVILYELLAGQHPYRGAADLAGAICTLEPARPSSAVRGLRGDLDTIVLTAMHKAPERRYASAAAMGLDIERHLEGRPIAARPDSFGYRASKFVRRHKAFCAAAGLFVLSLAGGMLATVHMARVAQAERARAERRFEQVRKVANSFLFEFDRAIEKLPGSRPARTLVVKKALEYLDNLAQDAADDPSLLSELASAYERVAKLQGMAGGPNEGDVAGAVASLEKAIAMREAVAMAHPRSTADGLKLAEVYGDYGGLIKSDPAKQRHYFRKSLELSERLYAEHPQDLDAIRGLALVYWRQSNPLCGSADYPGCREWRDKSLRLYTEAARADPSARNRRAVAMMHKYVAAVVQKLRDYRTAIEHSRAAIAIDEELAAADPLNARAKRDLSFSYNSAAESLFWLERPDQALEYSRKALELREQLAAADPEDADLRFAVASAAALVGEAHLQLGHGREADKHFRQAIAGFEALGNVVQVRRLRDQHRRAQEILRQKAKDLRVP